jgi:hypothetical protein
MSTSLAGALRVTLSLPLVAVLCCSAVGTRDFQSKGYRTQMVADLLTLQSAESSAFARTGRYTLRPPNYDSTDLVSWPAIRLNRDSTAYAATVTHGKLPNVVCGLAKGMPNPVDATAPDGDYRCTKP